MNLNFKSNLIIEIIEELGLLFQAPTVNPKLGSASDVTHTDLWLNVCCIWYTYLETLQECRSRCRIGWIIQDFQETCVSRSLMFCLEIKTPWRQKPSRKKKVAMFTNVTANAYQSQLNAGFSKVCEIFKVHGIESLKYIREFHTPFVILVTFPRPKTWCRMNRTVIVGQTASWAGLGQWTRPSIPDL